MCESRFMGAQGLRTIFSHTGKGFPVRIKTLELIPPNIYAQINSRKQLVGSTSMGLSSLTTAAAGIPTGRRFCKRFPYALLLL